MLIKDAVCEMQVDEGKNQFTYLGVAYSFCSEQCRERFQENPHLYIGVPGQKAPKQKGLSVIKQRRMFLAQPLTPSQAKTLSEVVQAMMGIQSITVEGDSVVIVYDLLQATAEQIEEKLAEIGVQLGGGLGDSLRRAFVHYKEECEVGNLEVQNKKHGHRH
ncbi:MAG: YHS domain-containing protein [Gallionella sp.]